ncbi:MAG: hypothetical protein JO180_00675 [Gemmatirosa sp.]|nr:hypothetical protein [Gemmatirosa sp.]
MPSTTRRLLLGASTIVGCHGAHAPAHAATPALVAEGRLREFGDSTPADRATSFWYGRFGVAVTIHGQTLDLVADHGADATVLTDRATARVGMSRWLETAARIDTIVVGAAATALPADSTPEVTLARGDTVFRYWGVPDPPTLDSLRVGTSRQDSVLLSFDMPAAALAPFDGLLGRDILTTFDLLFDLPAGTLRLHARSPAAAGRPPAWLPNGITSSDCMAAPVRRHLAMAMDTTTLGADDRRELQSKPLERLWNEEEMQLPMTVDGRPVRGVFDSGAGGTSINWAEAHALGITRASPRVHAYMAGGFRLLSGTRPPIGPPPAPGVDSTFTVTGLSLRIGHAPLPSDTVFIADPDFADFPNRDTEPIVSVGLRQLRDYRLFFSYSTGFLCLTRRR